MPPAHEELSDVPSATQRNRGKGLAAAAVVIIATGTLVGLRFLPTSPPTTTVDASSASAEVASPKQSIDELWPQAVHEVPQKLPDGSKVRPRAFLDDTTLIVTAESAFEKADRLIAYDLKSGKVTKLSDIPTPDGASIFASGFTTGEGRIIWWTARKKDGQEVADIWSASTSGGEPAVVTSFSLPPRSPEGIITAMTVTPKGLAWSVGSMGVFTAPLSGGEPKAVSGTQGQHILTWPWVGSPGLRGRRSVPYQAVLNVETGERRGPATPQNTQVLACGITQCVNRQGNTGDAKIQNRNGQGVGEVALPAVMPQPLLQDRFLVGEGAGWSALYDIKSGTGADLKADAGVRYLQGSDPRLLMFSRGDKYLIVDLASIP